LNRVPPVPPWQPLCPRPCFGSPVSCPGTSSVNRGCACIPPSPEDAVPFEAGVCPKLTGRAAEPSQLLSIFAVVCAAGARLTVAAREPARPVCASSPATALLQVVREGPTSTRPPPLGPTCFRHSPTSECSHVRSDRNPIARGFRVSGAVRAQHRRHAHWPHKPLRTQDVSPARCCQVISAERVRTWALERVWRRVATPSPGAEPSISTGPLPRGPEKPAPSCQSKLGRGRRVL